MFVVLTVCCLLSAWYSNEWRRASKRRVYVHQAGRIDGHPRTIKGLHIAAPDRASLRWWLFGDRRVIEFNLYSGTYDDEYLQSMRLVFPEAQIAEARDGD